MNPTENPLRKLDIKMLFLVWGRPIQGPRSRVMSRELGIELAFVHTKLPRGRMYAPPRYLSQTIRTIFLLFRRRPQLVFVQSPPLFAVLAAYLYCVLTASEYIVDAHSAALLGPWWRVPPTWLRRLLAKRAITTMVTNEFFKQRVESLGGNAFVLRDVPTKFHVNDAYPLDRGFTVALVNVFSSDEPLVEALDALANLSDVNLYVTGKVEQRHQALVERAPPNVHFTDFLPDRAYYGLLSAVDAVMCLTTRDHTMQRGACEALWLGKPIITSDWPLLRRYFRKGTVHVENTVEGIREGTLSMKNNYSSLAAGIKALQLEHQSEWQRKLVELTSLVDERLARHTGSVQNP